jgi:hypothetical protein
MKIIPLAENQIDFLRRLKERKKSASSEYEKLEKSFQQTIADIAGVDVYSTATYLHRPHAELSDDGNYVLIHEAMFVPIREA